MTERMAGFVQRMQRGEKALIPYFTSGFPTLEDSLETFASLAENGGDCLEIGVPFSDPLADGPTIQKASQVALKSGGGLLPAIEQVKKLRLRGLEQPFVLFGYFNPVYRMGLRNFAETAAEAGVDAALVPDIPLEESAPLEEALSKYGLSLVHLVAPTSTDDRIALAHQRSNAFIYAVSVTGVTGAREALPPDLEGFVARAKGLGEKPVVVGFGVKTPEQARYVAAVADGVVVGSAFIDAAERDGTQGITGLAANLKKAVAGFAGDT